jgi:hypothetical protein
MYLLLANLMRLGCFGVAKKIMPLNTIGRLGHRDSPIERLSVGCNCGVEDEDQEILVPEPRPDQRLCLASHKAQQMRCQSPRTTLSTPFIKPHQPSRRDFKEAKYLQVMEYQSNHLT